MSLWQSVTEVPGRQLVHDADLVEMDPETFVQMQRVHAFLLSDSLMMATWVPTRYVVSIPLKKKPNILFQCQFHCLCALLSFCLFCLFLLYNTPYCLCMIVFVPVCIHLLADWTFVCNKLVTINEWHR